MNLPEPGLEARPVTLDEYQALTPEKLELFSGYLIDPPDAPEERRRLLVLLLVNLGLVEVVKLAPEARWRQALERAYDRGGRASGPTPTSAWKGSQLPSVPSPYSSTACR